MTVSVSEMQPAEAEPITYDTARRRNEDHPVGTPVVVMLANGQSTNDQTASGAVQWGSTALVTLRHRNGLWMTEMLQASAAVD